MNGIVIGAGPESISGIQRARAMGHRVAAVDGNARAEGLSYADIPIIADLKDPMAVVRALQGYQPAFMIPVPIGRSLTCSGFLAGYYHLKGISYESSILCTDKYLFHEKMQAHGLRAVPCGLIPAGADVDALRPLSREGGLRTADFSQTKLPVILKPRFGSGSRGVVRIDTDAQLEAVKNSLPFEEDYILEGLLAGEEYGIDGAAADGRFHLILLRKKLLTPPPACQCIAYASIKREDRHLALFEKIEAYMQKAVQALGLRDCLLHADLMVSPDGGPAAVEISGRPSGHRLHDLFTPLAAGVDMVKEFIQYSLGRPFCFTPVKTDSIAIRYFDFENCRVVRRPDPIDLQKRHAVLAYQCNIGDAVLGPVKDGHSIMNRGYFILAGGDAQDAFEKCQEVLDLFVLDYNI